MSVTVTKYGNVSKAIEEGNELAIEKLVIGVTGEAKTMAEVATGQMRNSIMGRVYKKDNGFNDSGKDPAFDKLTVIAKEGEGYVGSNLLHAIYNEFGTRKMAAHPFLRPAIAVKANGATAKASVTKFQKQSVAEGMRKGPRVAKKYGANQ